MSAITPPHEIARGRRAKRAITIALSAVLTALILYLGLSAYISTQVIKTDRRPILDNPTRVGLKFEAVSLKNPDGFTNAAWLFRNSGDRALVMIHGLNGNRADKEESKFLELAKDYFDAGMTVLMIDLRGHGESGGERLGLGWEERKDVGAAVDFLQTLGFKPGKIGLHGASYGAATSILAAETLPAIGAVVADSSWSDFRVLLNQEIQRRNGAPPIFTPGITLFTGVFYGLDLPAIQPVLALARLGERPVYLIHSNVDRRIPVQHSQELKASTASRSVELWVADVSSMPDGKDDHVRAYTVQRSEYLSRVLPFFERNLR